jgi:hypothetical protein
MAKSSLLALSKDFLLEFVNTNFGLTTTEAPIHLHNNWYGGADRVQVLNADTSYLKTGNVRTNSFYSNHNNTTNNQLLTPTPFSYSDIASAVHTNALVGGITSTVPYKIVRLHFRSGWSYPTGTSALALKIRANYGNRQIDLLNFYADSSNNLLVPNSNNLWVGSVLYASYIEFKIVDLSRLSVTQDVQLQGLFNSLLDIPNFASFVNTSLTNLTCEASTIDTADLSVDNLTGANTGGANYDFTKFTVGSWSSGTKFLTDTLTTLNTTVAVKNKALAINLNATGALSVEEQLGGLTTDLSYINITHYVSVEEFDINPTSLGVTSNRYSNDVQEWGEVKFIPILQADVNSINITIRTRIEAFDNGYDISYISTLTVSGADLVALKQSVSTVSLDITPLEIINQINKQVVTVTGGSPNTTNINLKSETVFVHYNKINVTNVADSSSALFESTDFDKSIQLFESNAVYSFEFLQDSNTRTLPATALHITESGSSMTHKEISRVGNKVLFRLNSGLFNKQNLEIHDDSNNVLASFKIIKV